MFGRKEKLTRSLFSAGILKTFGKLDQQDIDNINGSSDRLASQLIQQYGWSPEDAQSRVEGLRATLSKETENSEMTPNAGVGS